MSIRATIPHRERSRWHSGGIAAAESEQVHLWRVDLDAAPPPAGVLSAAERERAAAIQAADDGRRWAVSRWALREVLGRCLGEPPGAVELALGAHGKPELASAPERLEFNLSHSGSLALIAVADRAVGVDVEHVDPGRDHLALARRVLEADAVEAVRDADAGRRPAVFYAAWTAHEARLKCDGGGFGARVGRGPSVAVPVPVPAGYAAAVAVLGETAPHLRLQRLDLR